MERKAEIESRLTTESDVDFLFDLQSLTALAGDSHTSIQVAGSVVEQLSAYPMVLSWRDGRWYLTTAPAEQKALLGMEVTALNGRDMDQVVEAFGEVLSADNPVKLRRQYRQVCNVEDYYVYLGLAKPGEPLKLTLEDGETRSITAVPYHSLGRDRDCPAGRPGFHARHCGSRAGILVPGAESKPPIIFSTIPARRTRSFPWRPLHPRCRMT